LLEVAVPEGFVCSRCGKWHPGLAYSYHAAAPIYWRPEMAEDSKSELAEDQCVIQGKDFFIRGLIQIAVVDGPQAFEWGVWVSLSRESFLRAGHLWETPGRESEPPYVGWLATNLTAYGPSTLNLKADVHTRPVGLRPLIELEPTNHPLAVEQQHGITVARVREFAELLAHA
jgi:hypothetical protein